MKKDVRKNQDWRVSALFTPTSGPLPRRGKLGGAISQARRAGWGRAGGGAAPRLRSVGLEDPPEPEPTAAGLPLGGHFTPRPSRLLFRKERVIALVIFSLVIGYPYTCM